MFGLAFCLLLAAGPPQRIVSTAPSITEMLYALGLGDRVAAVTTYCRYPPEALKKPKIGSYTKPDLELILRLQPDLVVSLEKLSDLKTRLARFGTPVLEVRNETIDDIYASLLELGRRTGTEAEAHRRVAEIRSGLRGVGERVQSRPRRRVMFVVGRTPGTVRDLIAVGRASYLNDLIERAGGVNVFADAPVGYPRISREEVLARRPEVIIDTVEDPATARLWRTITPARVHSATGDIFVLPGPRVAEAARELARMIHPEAGL